MKIKASGRPALQRFLVTGDGVGGAGRTLALPPRWSVQAVALRGDGEEEGARSLSSGQSPPAELVHGRASSGGGPVRRFTE